MIMLIGISKIFHLGEWRSVWFFYEFSWTKVGGSAFSFVVWGGYGGVKPDVECGDEPGIIDKFFHGIQG